MQFVGNLGVPLGFGEVDESGHPIQSLTQEKRNKQIARLAVKILLVLGTVFALTLHVTSPLVALGVTFVVAAVSFAVIFNSYRKIHSYPTPLNVTGFPETPELGELTENRILPVKNGNSWKLRLIKQASRSIEISGSYCGETIFNQFLDEIEGRLRASVCVKILSCSAGLTMKNRCKMWRLSKQFPHLFQYQVIEQKMRFFPTYRLMHNHAKFVIVDGSSCVTGGTGILDMMARDFQKPPSLELKSSYMVGLALCDQDVVVAGPAARLMQKEFYKLYFKWSRQKLKAPLKSLPTWITFDSLKRAPLAKVAVITAGPEHGLNSRCKRAYLSAIKEARETIIIGNLNIDHHEMIDALIKKKRAFPNQKIKVITNGLHLRSMPGAALVGVVNELFFERLLKVGIEVYQYKKPFVMYHKKVFLSHHTVLVGTVNFCDKSMQENDENLLWIRSKTVADQMVQNFRQDMENSWKLTLKDVSGRPFKRLLGFVTRQLINRVV